MYGAWGVQRCDVNACSDWETCQNHQFPLWIGSQRHAPSLTQAILSFVKQRGTLERCAPPRTTPAADIYTSFWFLVRSRALGSLWPEDGFCSHDQCSSPADVPAGGFEFARPIAIIFEFPARVKVCERANSLSKLSSP